MAETISAEELEQQRLEIEAEREAARVARVRRWAPYRLPRWTCHQPGQLTDIRRGAEKNANIMGTPQAIETVFDGKLDVVEPEQTYCTMLGGLQRMPDWARKELGW